MVYHKTEFLNIHESSTLPKILDIFQGGKRLYLIVAVFHSQFQHQFEILILILGMKKDGQPDYNRQVKILCKHYRFLDPHYIRLLFEFCQFQALPTCKVLEILKDMLIPSAFIKKLVDSPNTCEDIIKDIEHQFNKKYGLVKLEAMEVINQQLFKEEIKLQKVEGSKFEFFENVPKDVCAGILSYLDPTSYSRMAQTNKLFNSLSGSDAMSGYFKNLCIKLFPHNQPPLPMQCRFDQIRDYVVGHPKEYGPNMTNAVMNNLRYFVWKSEPQSFKVEPSYYKSFGSYKRMFLNAPRIHFNGVYVCRHRYIKIGEKGFTNTITPLHVIYYYRYIRFFEDGSLLCYVTSTKCRKQKLAEILSRENLENFDPNNGQELKIGEYMQYKSKVYLKIVRCNTVFNYELEINSNQNKVSDELMVISYSLELVDEQEVVQNLYTYKEYKQKIIFNYLSNDLLHEENIGFFPASL